MFIPSIVRGLRPSPAKVLLDALGDRLHLRIRAAGADEEVVGQRRMGADLEQQEVVRLLVEGVTHAQQRGFTRVDRLQDAARLPEYSP
jgi:hypothetical protein